MIARVRARWLIAKGNRCRARRDWAQAAGHYRHALQFNPGLRPIWVQLGHALKESGSTDLALDAYRRARELYGTDGDAPFQLGVMAQRLGHVSEATAAFVQSIRENPSRSGARDELRQIVDRGFDEEFYKRRYPDVASGGMDPLVHYVEVGRHEGRAGQGARHLTHGDIRHLIVKEMAPVLDRDVALLVAHAPSGRLKPHVLPYIRQLRGSGLLVLLIVVVDRPLELLDDEIATADGVIVRDNGGYDFGAWADGFRFCPDLFGASLTVMTNDSVVPTADSGTFGAMIDQVRLCPADVIGLTASHEYGWHLQSYWLALRPAALSSWCFHNFINDIKMIGDKDTVIRAYEVQFSRRMQEGGLTVKAIFDGLYAANPTFFSWRDLISQGFPFIKLLMLREEFATSSGWPEIVEEVQREWPDVAAQAGFDVSLIHTAVRAAQIASVPAGTETTLMVAMPKHDAITTDHALRVAYFGPWNYDNAAGSASRDLLCALQSIGVRLNAFPIVKPFQDARLISPAVEMTDFAGHADIAIVHLAPGSWDILTEAQSAIVRSAKRRVGCWTPVADDPARGNPDDLRTIDRIWVPDRQWGEIFVGAAVVAVDVMPAGSPGGAVADAVRSSFSAMIDGAKGSKPAVSPPEPPEISVNLLSAKKIGQLQPRQGVIPVALGADLSWSGSPLPEGDPDDWLLFAPKDAGVAPDVISVIHDCAKQRPDVALFYADDVAGGEMMLDRIRLKPDFDRTLLAAQDYIGAPVFIRRRTLVQVGGLDRERGSAVLFDLVLRVAAAGEAISRITKVLIGYEGKRPVSDPDARRTALAARPEFHDMDFLDGAIPGTLYQRRHFPAGGYPAVSIVIPTRRVCIPDSQESYVEHLLARIAQADWPMNRLTVIVGDDLPGQPEWAGRSWPFRLVRIETPRQPDEPFNYALKMNRLWPLSDSEQIIFMNDDVAPTGSDWLAALVGFSSDESVGGVGARLHYEDGSIQHAGLYPAFKTAMHAWLGWPASAKTYQDWAAVQREWSMVTGAVFATRRSTLERLHGFDEKFGLEFNDIDLCLRMRNLGYRIVYNPLAEFIHAEKASRGQALPPGAQMALFLSRWSRWLQNDPASHPGFVQNRIDLVAAADPKAWYAG